MDCTCIAEFLSCSSHVQTVFPVCQSVQLWVIPVLNVSSLAVLHIVQPPPTCRVFLVPIDCLQEPTPQCKTMVETVIVYSWI